MKAAQRRFTVAEVTELLAHRVPRQGLRVRAWETLAGVDWQIAALQIMRRTWSS